MGIGFVSKLETNTNSWARHSGCPTRPATVELRAVRGGFWPVEFGSEPAKPRIPLVFSQSLIKIGGMEGKEDNDAMSQLRSGPLVLPSLLLCDFGNLARELEQLEEAGVKALHLDVMDGHFVPNLTYGMPIVEGIRKLTSLPIDVHLMISEPSKYVQQFIDAGSDCITIHAEIEEDELVSLEKIRSHGVGAGIAINPDTPLVKAEKAIEQSDLLLVMSVNAGFGGQAFNPVALEKLKAAQARYPNLLLEVDGGVNIGTIADCHQAGASLFVVGSAIFGQDDYRIAVERLSSAIGC